MLVELNTSSGKALDPSVRARSPSEMNLPQENVVAKQEPDPSRLSELLSDVRKNLNRIHNVALDFTVHEASGKIIIKVTDASTGQVIREVPPSEVLDLAARLDEMLGLIFDQKG